MQGNWQYKGARIRKDFPTEVVHSLKKKKEIFAQVKLNDEASGVLPKESWVDTFILCSELSWEHELYESRTSTLHSVSFKRG